MRLSFIAAPVLLFLYGIARFVDGLDGVYGPGIAWTLGHVMFFLALVIFSLVIVGLYFRIGNSSRIGRLVAGLAASAGLIGLIFFARIAMIDIITGLRAPDHAAMSVISSQLNAYPDTPLRVLYNFGPFLFQIGLLMLMLQLAILRPHKLPWWSPALLSLGFLILGFNTKFLIPGAILIGFSLIPLTTDLPRFKH